MKYFLLIVFLISADLAEAQTDTAESNTFTVYVRKRKAEIFVRTESNFRLDNEGPAFVNQGGLRIGIVKKKHQIIEKNEYVMVDPVPLEDSITETPFDIAKFLQDNLEYNCPLEDTSLIDSVVVDFWIESNGVFSHGVREFFRTTDTLSTDPCKKQLKAGVVMALNKIIVFSPGGMLFSDGRVIPMETLGNIKIFLARRPFTPNSEGNSIPPGNAEIIKN